MKPKIPDIARLKELAQECNFTDDALGDLCLRYDCQNLMEMTYAQYVKISAQLRKIIKSRIEIQKG